MAAIMESLDALSTDIKYILKAQEEMRTDVKEIRYQTQKTNGRMTKAEEDIRDLQQENLRRAKGKDNWSERYLAPIVTGVILGLVMIAIQIVGRFLR